MTDIFNPESLFLIVIAFIWIIVAIIQDIRKREVANWWNFSLIVAALIYRSFLSLYTLNYWYVLGGIIGFAVGFLLANLFYYARMFAGGDAKLMLGLGTILPLSLSWKINLSLFIWWLILFLVVGGIYGLIYSLVLCIVHKTKFKKEFIKQFRKYRFLIWMIMLLAIVLVIFASLSGLSILAWLSIIIFIAPLLLAYAKAVEESCMYKRIGVTKLTIGDWLAKEVKVRKRYIRPNWEGLSEKELKNLKENYKGNVLIKVGIPFTPTFLIAFVLLLLIFGFNLNTLIILF